ncbi:hypothetical protein FVEG_08015 [Fusarium verticillioides 7600]|uniref:Uncharacterized protein n=1 Tax=Gibberella moniliformis (strain M3125 / FGSC 7600) TaxID=334819 RepID=W7MAR2_GIBM7|nr:hypothetical protein FVEG_08015 [Fusarium verticillioides 7600]EWG48106.1 hypothetical protein FVEG_08015 [Fusarium verticillioides 7600]
MGKLNHGCPGGQGTAVCCRFLIECKGSYLILLSQSSPGPSLAQRTRDWIWKRSIYPRHQTVPVRIRT